MRMTAAFLPLLVLAGVLPADAQTGVAAPPAAPARVLGCYAAAHTLGRLVNVATTNLRLVANAATQGTGSEQQHVVLGMLASGTLADQQPALDLAEQLELCVTDAVDRATPDPTAAFLARELAVATQVGIDAATGFSSDFERVAPVLTGLLAASGDPALQQATNGTYSRFGVSISETLHRVRLAVSELVAKSTPR